eukprot:TRINITY_DN2776_c0_g1_i2.p1 TRINITY_DN2776_c0_g1~~TRINITY_DN2776_c0_g1_i2.p1  ORF type:complete len:1012 (-),score=176.54 TRINITY_DN2776_c0_g1_i2:20-3019(-)
MVAVKQTGCYGLALVLLSVLACVFVFGAVPTEAAPQLNLHIVAHTHDDVGWLKTVDEYYYGANNTIQRAGVQYILDTVVQQLQLNPARRFIYVEIAYFMRWWREQSMATHAIVRELVRNGQLEFVNGGWVMNDEACTLYPATIDQMTEGHTFLYNNFGVRPTIGWQIDPFGHSNTQAALFAQMGFNAVFFARSDYQDYERRKNTSQLEFIWRFFFNDTATTEIYTHIFYDSTYCEADGFSFQDDNIQPVMDDPRLENYNIDKVAKRLVDLARERSKHFTTSQIFFTFGCDFQFQDAVINFKNMDKLIEYINARPSQYGVKVLYSTPATYVAAVHEESAQRNLRWTVNNFDFFPYRDDQHSVWAGYFVSHAALKGYVRSRSNLLHSVNNLLTTAAGVVDNVLTRDNYERSDNLAQACGVTQHHDSVTGTEKEHVASDYAKQLSIGTANVQALISDVAGKLLTSAGGAFPTFSFCDKLNVSFCPALDNLRTSVVPVIVYNPLAWERTVPIRLPVPINNIQVVDSKGAIVPSQVFTNGDYSSIYTLVFTLTIPPLGWSNVVVQSGASAKPAFEETYEPSDVEADRVIQNQFLSVTISGTTGRIQSVQNKAKGITVSVNQDLAWYNASAGNNVLSNQPSGAYIFRPNGTMPWNMTNNNVATVVSVVQGSVVQEVRQYWTSWAYQTLRLYQNADFIEVETTIGPIPINDHFGKEIITRYSTSLKSASVFYTDSNGQEFMRRQRDFRPTYKLNNTEPVADNYYPINTAAYLEDTSAPNGGVRFTIITDRSQGGGSLSDGEMEVMLHRRLLYDDYRGVGEPLNQSDIVRSVQLALFDRPADSARRQRSLSLELNGAAQVFFANWADSAFDWFSTYSTDFAPLAQALPPNVHLLNLRTLSSGETYLRLNHIYAVGEDVQYSKPVTVDLATLFKDLTIVSLHETSLTANTPIYDFHRLAWNVTSNASAAKGPFADAMPATSTADASAQAAYYVTLRPMEIRTFIVRFQ